MTSATSLDDCLDRDATGQAELLKEREISALELIDAAIARLEREHARLNLVVRTDFERARERARAVDAQRSPAPFAGVPTLLKDIGAEEAGQPIAMGMRVLRDSTYRSDRDSEFFLRLRAAGLIPLGRTNMPELAILATSEPDAFGPTRNPWNPEHTAGGSSGGAAAAVAAGVCAVAHASDGGGSIRGPANMCSLVGLKPTRGRCSFGPARGERWSSLSVEFMLTRSVRDCAALLDMLGGPALGDPYFAAPPSEPYATTHAFAPRKLRIAFSPAGRNGVEVDPECAGAVSAIGRSLEALGHAVEEALPSAFDSGEAPPIWLSLVSANIARSLEVVGQELGRTLTREDVEPLTFALAEHGSALRATQHLQTIDAMHAFGRKLNEFFTHFDLLLTPTQAAPPPRLGYLSSTVEEPFRALLRSTPYGVFTLPFNLSGQPAISIPAGVTASGLPIGVQLAAAYGREDLLLQVAAQLEAARPFPRLPMRA